jgi:hypothetical protein
MARISSELRFLMIFLSSCIQMLKRAQATTIFFDICPNSLPFALDAKHADTVTAALSEPKTEKK